jgi:nucleoside 2-deoxyribosyltransferase
MGIRPLKIYFAGDLFDAKDLGGNLLLASAIEKISAGNYQIMLPQNGECEITERSSQSIRDADFELLCQCDIIVANFDGHDLDSGTVVEFCFAKMLDMPAVLLRTDFRHSGDQTLADGEPWNLMCSHYPRTRVLHINGMMRYHKVMQNSPEKTATAYYDSLATDVTEALADVIRQPAWLKPDELLRQYQLCFRSIGGTLAARFPEEKLLRLIAAKKSSGLY